MLDAVDQEFLTIFYYRNIMKTPRHIVTFFQTNGANYKQKYVPDERFLVFPSQTNFFYIDRK